jgi:hypothetical protein
MPFVFKRLVLLLSIAAAFAADKDAPFRAAPAANYKNHQTNEKVTIGVEPYDSGEKLKAAFGKLNPYDYGVLPVLVVIQNDGNQTIRLDRIKAEYVGPGNNRVEATPARDVRYLRGPDRPKMIPGPAGRIKIGKGKKNPLDAWEIEGRAFSAQMLPAGQSASGFFYFQTGLQTGSTLYLNGLREAGTGKELFYFEIPLH